MKDKTLIEKLFLISGIIILLIGLFIFIDFTKIIKYIILASLVVSSIILHIVFINIREKYHKTSTILGILSWALAIITFYMFTIVLDLQSLSHIVPLLASIYTLIYLKIFDSKYFLHILIPYAFIECDSILYASDFRINIIFFILITFIRWALLIHLVINITKIYHRDYKPNPIISFIQNSMLIFFPFLMIVNLSEILELNIPFEVFTLVLIASLGALIYFKVTDKFIYSKKPVVFYFSALSCCLSSLPFWEGLFDGNLPVIMTVISAALIIVFLIKLTLSGNKLAFFMLFVHIILFFITVIYEHLSLSIFMIILGMVLISLGYILEKKRVKEEKL